MAEKFDDWLKETQPRHENLTTAAVSIINSLLSEAKIAVLSVSGRTKSPTECVEKAKRKAYKNPVQELTDISGIRIIVYFEHDISAVSDLVEKAFRVDQKNSMNRDELLSTNEVGYHSVHYVCDIGKARAKLPEFSGFENLKFEIQIRTVLQHAWAELAHDRNYKFSGNLPKPLERKLFLLAGLLEQADSGFSELSQAIDKYIDEVSRSTSAGELDIELNSLSLPQFVKQWAKTNRVILSREYISDYTEILRELSEFGIRSVRDLSEIIPDDYGARAKKYPNNIHGTVRDWMMISDPEKFLHDVTVNWILSHKKSDTALLRSYLSADEIKKLRSKMGTDELGLDSDEEFDLD